MYNGRVSVCLSRRSSERMSSFAAARSTALSSKCGQCHVDNRVDEAEHRLDHGRSKYSFSTRTFCIELCPLLRLDSVLGKLRLRPMQTSTGSSANTEGPREHAVSIEILSKSEECTKNIT